MIMAAERPAAIMNLSVCPCAHAQKGHVEASANTSSPRHDRPAVPRSPRAAFGSGIERQKNCLPTCVPNRTLHNSPALIVWWRSQPAHLDPANRHDSAEQENLARHQSGPVDLNGRK
jgi:hypothetical protein